MNGKAEGQGKWEERRQNKHSCCQYWEGRKADAACATQKKSSSSASSVSLSGPLVWAFLTSCQGKTPGSTQVSPACPHPTPFNQAYCRAYAQGLTTHRSDLTLQHLGTFHTLGCSKIVIHSPPPTTNPSFVSGLFTTQISSVLP